MKRLRLSLVLLACVPTPEQEHVVDPSDDAPGSNAHWS